MARTTARGYGHTHQQLRARLLRAMRDGDPCCLCSLPMWHGTPLDLDHTPTRDGYRGLAHASCNRSDGARRGNEQRTRHARDW
jgi:hypothetical protein